jgi:hypothetical protein
MQLSAADWVVFSPLLTDWYVVLFEACKEKSPTEAGIDLFGLSYTTSLIALMTGVVVKKTGNYVIPIHVGWVLMIIGAGLLTTLRADSSMAKYIGFQVPIGCGVGIVYVVSLFPILASIPVTQSASAMALFVSSRNFGQVGPSPSQSTSTPSRLSDNFATLDLGCHCRRHHFAE